ncbi:MAG: cupin domain-containing protein, partial [Chloroflexota bacterium]
PMVGVDGIDSMGMVCFEIEPGNSLGMHTDSQDEIVVLLSGKARAKVGEEIAELSAGGVAFIPAMVPHGFDSIGDEPLRVVGIFADPNVVSTFEYPIQPWGVRAVVQQETAGRRAPA